MKILSLDVGQSRIGSAIGDSEIGIAFAREVILNNSVCFEKIKIICWQEKIEKIIIGLPLFLTGQESEQSKNVKLFAHRLKKVLPKEISVQFFDERFSTQEAERKIKEIKKKGLVKDNDCLAAANFLQTFLEK